MASDNAEIQKMKGAVSVDDPDSTTTTPIRRSNRVAQKNEEVENAKKRILNNNEREDKQKKSIEKHFSTFEQKTKPIIIVNDTRAQLELASRQYKPNVCGDKQNTIFVIPPKLTFSPKKNVTPQISYTITPSTTPYQSNLFPKNRTEISIYNHNCSTQKSHTVTSTTTLSQNKESNLFPPNYTKISIHNNNKLSPQKSTKINSTVTLPQNKQTISLPANYTKTSIHNNNELLPQKSNTITSTTTPAQNKQTTLFLPATTKLSINNSSPTVLPSLTDDMFVMEAPSFIIPYVYEKPPKKSLKEFLNLISKDIEKAETKEVQECLGKHTGEKRKSDERGTEPDALVKVAKLMPKTDSLFDTTLGEFFVNIGENLVKEFVQRDLLDIERVKLRKERKKIRNNDREIRLTISSLAKNLELSERANSGFNFDMRKCNICSFKTESALALEHHKETPHMRMDIFKCNFCLFEIRSPHDILYHVEHVHGLRARLERAPAPYQCPNCFFEDTLKHKTLRHVMTCCKKFKPQFNLKPGLDWEFPAKIPSRIPFKMYMSSMYRGQFIPPVPATLNRPPNLNLPRIPLASSNQSRHAVGHVFNPPILQRVPDFIKKPIARVAPQGLISEPVSKGIADEAKTLSDPTKSITYIKSIPFPIKIPNDINCKLSQSSLSQLLSNSAERDLNMMCEICDYHLKSIHNLRFHMKMFHKITINEKISALRPPLNCQKCTSRFFTDQGLERHLLGSHGLITPAMEQAAQNNTDSGRCPICGKTYQWKLVAHVKNDHNKILKPAHLSYRCTVCSKLFALYKDFEKHVFVSHSPSVLGKNVVTKDKAVDATVRQLNLGNDVSLTKV